MGIKYIENTDLVIHHAYKVRNDDLMGICITKSHSSPTLYWSDGVLFFFEAVPPLMNSKIEEDFVNGKEHWSEVYYSPMKECPGTLEMSEGEFRGAKIRVINASAFSPHSDFAKWARGQVNFTGIQTARVSALKYLAIISLTCYSGDH